MLGEKLPETQFFSPNAVKNSRSVSLFSCEQALLVVCSQRRSDICSGSLSCRTQDSAGSKERGLEKAIGAESVAPESDEKVIMLPATSMHTPGSSPAMVTS